MDQVVPGKPDALSSEPRRYELFHRGQGRGLVWRFRDEGVVLTPAGIEWRTDGAARSMPYAEIESIRIESGHIPKSGYFGTCTIVGRGDRTIAVNSLNSWGTADPGRLADYADFVQDLHARLSDDDRRRIRFNAGMTEGRQMFGKFAAILGGAFFLVLPVGLLIWTGEVKALFLALAGAIFVIPAFRLLKKNEPRSYDPQRLDDDLFPHI
ncbi:MAG: hypothetical protein KDK07_15995 [Bauldia sp.]|nr:hypothetical protein [Bauldia sp.]